MQNRGYDSAGIATMKESELRVDKMTSNFDEGVDCIQEIIKMAKKNHTDCKIGIGHTRWATCGEINN